MLVLLQLVVHGGEHALVLRRTHASRAAQHEGLSAVLLDSLLFLECVDLHSGQRLRHLPCGIHGGTAQTHLECRDDVQHEHRKHAQRRIDPAIERRRGYQPSVRVFVPCHGRDYTRAQGPVDSAGRCPPKSGASGLRSRVKVFRRPTN